MSSLPAEEEVLVDYEADEEEEDEEEEEILEKKTNGKSAKEEPEAKGQHKDHSVTPKRKIKDEDASSPSSAKRARMNGDDGGANSKNAGGSSSQKTAKTTAASIATYVQIHAGNAPSGIYIPPFRRRQMEQEKRKEIAASSSGGGVDKQHVVQPSLQDQRLKWEDLKKAIHGTINRLSNSTIKALIHELFQKANLVRGKGLFAKAILRAATTSPAYAPVYAALIAVINTKLPEIGELCVIRAILSFRKSYARQDRGLTLSVTTFLGCLFNQGLCHELLCLQLLTILLEGDPTDDSVEVAVSFSKVVGMALLESSPAGVHAVMERFRNLLHDGSIGRRVQYKIEELMKIRRKGFKEYPTVVEDLDLVERDDQIMHEVGLDDEGLEEERGLDVFNFDDEWNENESSWLEIRKEILGEGSSDEEGGDDEGESETDDDEDGEASSDDDDDEDGVLQESQAIVPANKKQIVEIQDLSEKDLINLRRTIYLTIMSSATFEECAHKLAKMDIPEGKEMELINMIIECCSQERTFLRYYGLISGRFCLLHQRWQHAFSESFVMQYNTIHRLETNKLRNVAKLFAHLLHTDSLPWSCLSVIHLNEDETTSSSRIFLKILVQEMAEAMGIAALVKRFETDDPERLEWFKELFPRDNPRKTRYAINFFTSIGLGPLTDGLRDHLKNAPKLIMMQAEAEARKALEAKDDSSSSDDSSSVSSTSSSSSFTSTSSSSVSSSSYTSTSSGSSSSYTSSSSSVSSRGRSRGRSRSKRKRSSRRRSYSSSSSASTSSRSRSRTPVKSKSRRKYDSRSPSRSESGGRSVGASRNERKKKD